MAPREDVVVSAVAFLQDPSVASSPLEKRIEFLRSKNLTQEEVDLSLARANEEIPATAPGQAPNGSYYTPQQQSSYRRTPQPGDYSYSTYGGWQAPPPEVPKRDWRDWFIMATVVGGAGYGLWVLTERYIKPLIAPPTPPQLEQDKAAIDEQFSRAFALLDTLSSDTTALKEAEEARTQRLDTTLTDVESVVVELKAANQRREDETRRMEAEIKSIKDSLPNALDIVRESSDKRLKELGRELSSLKLLMGNRFGTSPVPTSSTGYGMAARPGVDGESRSGTASPAPETLAGSEANVTGVNKSGTVPSFSGFGGSSGNAYPASAASAASALPSPLSSQSADQREARTRIYGAPGTTLGKASIPSWQMAALAADKNKTKPVENGSVNGASSGIADETEQPSISA